MSSGLGGAWRPCHDSLVNAEIVAVGTELLLGQIPNTNARWISERLAEVGVGVHHHQAVGDNVPRIVDAIRLARSRADVVILTGGLGPTQDDVTREAIADALDRRSSSSTRERWKSWPFSRSKGQQYWNEKGGRFGRPFLSRARHGAGSRPGGRRRTALRGAGRPLGDAGDDARHDPSRARAARRTVGLDLPRPPMHRDRRVQGGGAPRRPVRGKREPDGRVPGLGRRGEGSAHGVGEEARGCRRPDPSRRRGGGGTAR